MITGSDECQKIVWAGTFISVQPRIRLTRSFDQRHHSYQGYVLGVDGQFGEEKGGFLVGVGKAAHAKHQFQVGMEVTGVAVPVPDPRLETASFYKSSAIKVIGKAEPATQDSPPYMDIPPDLETYRARGHRRLDTRTYGAKCSTCTWGCRMPVEMIIDQWNPSKKKYRFETFCYGPLGCSLYRAGPNRKVPGRNGMTYIEEDWIDEEETSHRGPED